MSITNPKNVVTEQRLSEFYGEILPYLGGASQICIGGGYAPIGTVISFMGTTAPGSYLVCDGTVYNIAQYPLLADFFETQFGSANYFGGDGNVTFAVPDLRGEFLRGTGTNSHTNQGNGANVGVHQDATIQNVINSQSAYNILYIARQNGGLPVNADKITSNSSQGRLNISGSSDSYSDDAWYSARPTNTSVLYCIKAETENTYSSTEKIVGTWVDGKPLYQKTLTISTITQDTWAVVAELASNCNIQNWFGYVIDINNQKWKIDTNYVKSDVNDYINASSSAGNNVLKLCPIGMGVSSGYVTVQYTKAS